MFYIIRNIFKQVYFYRSEIARAFKIWSDVADLTFTEVTASGNVDIDISFETGDHGDGGAFDGPCNYFFLYENSNFIPM